MIRLLRATTLVVHHTTSAAGRRRCSSSCARARLSFMRALSRRALGRGERDPGIGSDIRRGQLAWGDVGDYAFDQTPLCVAASGGRTTKRIVSGRPAIAPPRPSVIDAGRHLLKAEATPSANARCSVAEP